MESKLLKNLRKQQTLHWSSQSAECNMTPKNGNEELDREIKQSCAHKLDCVSCTGYVNQSVPSGTVICECPACFQRCCEVQADVMGVSENVVQTSQDTVTFTDSTLSNLGGRDYMLNPASLADQTEATDLKDFFSRPVRIANFTWNESDPIGTTVTVPAWSLYFNDTRVQYKLNNFAFLQCKLKVKILINASPFYYGSMICSYQPLTDFASSTIVRDTGTRYLIPYSQRPSVWLTPAHNQGAEMTLPMLFQKNWLNAQSNAEINSMGLLSFINYTILQSANGVTGSGVSVAVYAWAEDVHLSGPSVGLATQADEYGKGTVSQPASAVANAAKHFEKVPFIGPFATATRIGAGAVSSIASLFGYTNVPVISDAQPFRNEAFPTFASAEIGYPIDKLTIDPKNELTVDSRVVGMDGTDELLIADLVQRESYLCTTTWNTSQIVDTALFTTPVSPQTCMDIDGLPQPRVYFTPLSWMSQLFQNWRGDIIFRFRIVASPFHKGRLRISYDPSGYAIKNMVNDPVSSNVIFTEIVDLDNTNEVEIRVPYQQALPFLNSARFTTGPQWDISSTPNFLYNSTFHNGTLNLRVQTVLTAPVASSNVSVMVFVRGAENLEFANPCNPPVGVSQWQPQSDEMTTEKLTLCAGVPSHVDDAQYLINFGEKIVSLRQVLRRMSLVSVSTTPTDTTSDYLLMTKWFHKIPPYFGFDTVGGIHTAKGLLSTSTTYKCNITAVTPINWVLSSFVGYRGSMNWSFNVTNATPLSHARAYRVNYGAWNGSPYAIDGFLRPITKSTPSVDAYNFLQKTDIGAAGSVLTSQITNAGLNVQCPMYTRFKMAQTSKDSTTQPTQGKDDMTLDAMAVEFMFTKNGPTNQNATLWAYAGIGTDFNPIFFLNVPTMWYYGPTLVPV